MLNDSSNKESKFATKKWYVIDSKAAKGKYKQYDSIKFEIESIRSTLCGYFDAFIFVTGGIRVNARTDTHVLFKSYRPFSTCKTKINDAFVDEANYIYIVMPMYKLIEYNDNYSVTLGSSMAVEILFLLIMLTWVLEFEAAFVGKTANAAGENSFAKDSKIVVLLKYLSNFWGLLEISLINCKIHFELNWI